MSLLCVKTKYFLKCSKFLPILLQHNVRDAHPMERWKPGPVPKTEKERLAAAKKYNMLPEEYESHGDDGMLGDYPKLPLVTYHDKDPYYPWDHCDHRTNHGEPLPFDFRQLGGDSFPLQNHKVKPYDWRYCPVKCLCAYLGTFIFINLVEYFGNQGLMFFPMSPEYFPKEGVVHYYYPS